MNRAVSSREEILKVSRDLIAENGLETLSIRKIAGKLGISAATIYSYFPSKSDLLSAAVESVWQEIFEDYTGQSGFSDFTCCLNWIFACLEKGEKQYPDFFLLQNGGHASSGQVNDQAMEGSWMILKRILSESLKNDPKISEDVFTSSFDVNDFTDSVFSLILSCFFLKTVSRNAVYSLCHKILYD